MSRLTAQIDLGRLYCGVEENLADWRRMFMAEVKNKKKK